MRNACSALFGRDTWSLSRLQIVDGLGRKRSAARQNGRVHRIAKETARTLHAQAMRIEVHEYSQVEVEILPRPLRERRGYSSGCSMRPKRGGCIRPKRGGSIV